MSPAQVAEILTDAENSHRTTPWEANFVASLRDGLTILGHRFELSPRQAEVLARIETKIYQTG